MKPLKLKIKSIGPYRNVSVDLAAIPGDIVAICGLNGEGKTMFMESIYAGIYRNFPSRPAGIYRYCTDRHAGIELEFEVAGNIYTSYINIDAKTRKMEAILACGVTALTDGLTGEFDEAIQRILGFEAQALSSSYGAQNKKGNFTELGKSDRKDLFISMIGAAHLQDISGAAKNQADAMEPRKDKLSGQLDVLKSEASKPIPDVEKLKAEAGSISKQMEALKLDMDILTEKIIADNISLQRIPELQKEKSLHESALKELLNKQQQLTYERDKAVIDIDSIPELRARLESFEDSAELCREIIISNKEKCSRLPEMEAAKKSSAARVASIEESRDVIIRSIREQTLLAEDLDGMRQKSAELSKIIAEESSSSGLLSKLNAELLSITQLEHERTKSLGVLSCKMAALKAKHDNQQLLLDAAKRGESFLSEVPCQGKGACGECKFLKDAIAAAGKIDQFTADVDNSKAAVLVIQQEMDAIPKENPAVKSKISDEIKRISSMVDGLRKIIESHTRDIAKLPEAEAAAGKLSILKESLETANQSMESATVEALTAANDVSEIERYRKTLEEAQKDSARLAGEIDRLHGILREREGAPEKLARINNDLEHLRMDISANNLRAESIDSDIKNLLTTVKLQYDANVEKNNENRMRNTQLAEEMDRINRLTIEAQAEAASIQDAIAKCSEVERSLNDDVYKIACYRRIAADFGPMAIQSFEIDSAGPEVSRIANELLFDCFGPRFSIRFVTQEAKADGKGFKDEFDVSVHDQRYDRWVSIDDLSGGEKVIVSEALALSIALYNRQKSGIAWETLFRDEVSGALDDKHAPQYLKMLRAAKNMGHFKRVYFISHQGRMMDMADSRIIVSGGEVTVES